MRNFFELKDNDGNELRIEYDENTLYVKAGKDPTQTETFESAGELDETLAVIKAELKEGGFVEINSGRYDEKAGVEEARKEYFDIANNELPQIIAAGFMKAMENHNKTDGEICCILDTGNEKSQMVFAYGDGGECENATDKSVFFTYRCDLLKKCESLVREIETLHLGQESSHWLTDAVKLAETEGAFKDLTITVYGNYQFGEIELDVIYEC